MRSYLKQIASFMKSLLHHSVLLYIQLFHCLFQITHTTMDEFRAPAACSGGEVIFFNQSSIESYHVCMCVCVYVCEREIGREGGREGEGDGEGERER